jgi:hypothetical protein
MLWLCWICSELNKVGITGRQNLRLVKKNSTTFALASNKEKVINSLWKQIEYFGVAHGFFSI